MKKWNLLLGLPYQVLGVLFDQPHSLSIILRAGEPPQIKEVRQAFCPAGRVKALVPYLPYQIKEDSLLCQLMAQNPVRLIEKSLENFSLSFEERVLRSLGKEITLIQPDSSGQEKYSPAILIGFRNKIPITFHHGILDFHSPGRIGFPSQPPQLLPSLNLSFENPKDQLCSCILYYLCPQLFWKAYYTAEIDSVRSRLTFQGTLKLYNLTGVPLEKASLAWVPSWRQFQDITPHALSGPLTIPSGTYHYLSFLSFQLRPSVTYHLDLSPLKINPERYPVQRRWIVKEIDLQKLPDGALSIYLKRPSDYLHISTSPLKKLSTRYLEISLDQNPQIYAELRQVQSRSLSQDHKENTYYLNFINHTSESIEMVVTLPLVRTQSFVRAYDPPQEEGGTFITWKITIPAQGERSFWYRMILPRKA